MRQFINFDSWSARVWEKADVYRMLFFDGWMSELGVDGFRVFFQSLLGHLPGGKAGGKTSTLAPFPNQLMDKTEASPFATKGAIVKLQLHLDLDDKFRGNVKRIFEMSERASAM